ncbi:hypothetical protein J2S04_002906 [Alicyclobacillus tengchongensis]|uniref:Helix-turn-helix conjugative transposon-like domain-containing protein n=1 Tax=Alicyclobacillus tolerans TaxID=90970 RepID=A0ABT9M071_9BACL|nr:hypothetical protein [Alicyclobacillus tengchongensis]
MICKREHVHELLSEIQQGHEVGNALIRCFEDEIRCSICRSRKSRYEDVEQAIRMALVRNIQKKFNRANKNRKSKCF